MLYLGGCGGECASILTRKFEYLHHLLCYTAENIFRRMRIRLKIFPLCVAHLTQLFKFRSLQVIKDPRSYVSWVF